MCVCDLCVEGEGEGLNCGCGFVGATVGECVWVCGCGVHHRGSCCAGVRVCVCVCVCVCVVKFGFASVLYATGGLAVQECVCMFVFVWCVCIGKITPCLCVCVQGVRWWSRAAPGWRPSPAAPLTCWLS